MKKILVAALVAVMSLVSVESNAKVLGVKAGANISSLSGVSSLDAFGDALANAANFQGGLVFNFGFGQKKIVALQPEVLISFRDASVDWEDLDLKLTTSRLEVPVNLQAGLNIGKVARVYVQAGPYFSYVLSDNTASFQEYASQIGSAVTDFDVSRFNWGIGIGAGVQLFSFQLSAKYDFGINELEGADVGSLWDGMKDRNLSISLAWFFL